MVEPKKRIEIIDALRGFAVVLMVIHHLLYNLVEFLGAPEWFFSNPVFDVLHYIFAGVFIMLSGVSSRFSRGNIKRGLIVIALAAGISAVTYLMDMPIWFGVLHLLGFSMLFFGVTKRFWDIVPRKASPIIFISLIVALSLGTAYLELFVESPIAGAAVSVLGWAQPGFVSYDYFPIFPWIFVFLLGTWAGLYIVERKLPKWFYEFKAPFFPKIGRKALLIYILHQPVLYGIVWLLQRAGVSWAA
ncbi:MAG: DUF1624 domain-containing protein [Oscillospiraceae bacterium]|nr:DUF1624 domain-containing protein [Oscillospiraceae bacterium]